MKPSKKTIPVQPQAGTGEAPETDLPSLSLDHGSLSLPAVSVDGYSLELLATDGYLGDSVSRGAFNQILDAWRTVYRDMEDGKDPFDTDKPTREISKTELATLLDTQGSAGATLHSAIEDYARQMTHVVRRFMRQKSWHGVERIVVGGGFQNSDVGQRAISRTAEMLAAARVGVQMRTLRHHSDEGGLIGWLHVVPAELLSQYDAMLAVDIGGTNVRCGIVRTRANKAPDLSKATVLGRKKWGHAEDDSVTRREDLVGGIADMLKKLVAKAKRRGISLAPVVGVSCPGLIADDGAINGGTQNLPGNWESTRFHLPRHLCEQLPKIGGQLTQVRLHNDAVVQGLSEMPFMQDVRHWAVLTVGTGLGNASYTNRNTLRR